MRKTINPSLPLKTYSICQYFQTYLQVFTLKAGWWTQIKGKNHEIEGNSKLMSLY